MWRRSIRALVIFAALTCVPQIAFASKWRPIGTIKDGRVYIDAASIIHRGRYIQAWFLWDYSTDQTEGSYPFKKFRSVKVLWYINCVEHAYVPIQEYFYSGDAGAGDNVDNVTIPLVVAHFQAVVPDSIEEVMVRFACAHQGENNR